MANLRCDAHRYLVDFSLRSKLALPRRDYFPAKRFQRSCVALVALDIPVELLLPISLVALRGGGHVASRVAMPEAAMDEHDSPESGQDDVRLSGKPLVVNPKPKS